MGWENNSFPLGKELSEPLRASFLSLLLLFLLVLSKCSLSLSFLLFVPPPMLDFRLPKFTSRSSVFDARVPFFDFSLFEFDVQNSAFDVRCLILSSTLRLPIPIS